MQSHCLNHQGRPATKRCVSCLKPLCDECTQLYTGGVFCSDQCNQAALQSEERAAKIAQSDKELKEWQQWQMAKKLVAGLVTVTVLYFGWDYFPEGVTEKIEQLWEAIKSLPDKLS